jgi:hypothetical protein
MRKSRLDWAPDGHLRVIAGGFQFAVAVEQRRVQLVGALDAGPQHRRAHAVDFAAGGVEDQQALGGKGLP